MGIGSTRVAACAVPGVDVGQYDCRKEPSPDQHPLVPPARESRLLERFLDTIERREAHIAILGLGYVGLPLASYFVQEGFRVTGFDINPAYVERLRRGESSVLDVPSPELQTLLDSGRFHPVADIEALRDASVHIICVPTPLDKTRQPDMRCIEGALELLLRVWAPGKLVVLESTTYPGTTEEVLLPELARGGLQLDRDFLLAFSPERVDPGNTAWPLRRIPKVVGGVSADSSRAAAELYQTIFETVHVVSNARTAEICKLLENTFRNVNIALVNEFAQICTTLDIDVWEAIEAARTKPFGFMAFYPGPGIGGHCIPLDPQYLVYKSRLHGYEPRLVSMADQINEEMPEHVVRRAEQRLRDRGLALAGARVLVLGAAYKPDVPDARESPFFAVAAGLQGRGARVEYCDPHVPELRLEDGTPLRAVPFTAEQVATADLVLIITAHAAFDYRLLQDVPGKVLDTRNAMKDPRVRGI